jgi:radical SAM protein with 4Fe4S-binding SPASM domain
MLDVAAEMRRAGVRKVLVSGGEPLLFPGLVELCRALTKNGILVDVNTNLTVAAPDTLAELRAADVLELTVSLDGATAEVYSGCRPGGELVRVIENAQLARSHGFLLDFTYVPTQLNIGEFERVADLAGQLGASSLTVAGLVLFGRAIPNQRKLQLTPVQIRSLRARIERYRKSTELPIRTNRISTPHPTEACQAARRVWGIDASGFVHPCALYMLPPDATRDLAERSFDDIVADFSGCIDLPRVMTGCQGCVARKSCPGGCLGIKDMMGIDRKAPDTTCLVNAI